MLRALIIDDEDHMRDTLARLLKSHCPEVRLVGQATGVTSGLAAINEYQPDMVFLDIQMQDGTGFDLLYKVPSIDFKVIFVTAYDQYAIQAFRCSAVDYLLKPVDPALLAEAVQRAGQMIREHYNIRMQALEENLKSTDRQFKKIILRTTENTYLLDMKNIIACESDSSYTVVHTSEGEKILVSKTLREYDDLLAGCGFYRVHKSFLINLSHIKRFEKQDGGQIVLTNNIRIPVASRKKDELLQLFEKMTE